MIEIRPIREPESEDFLHLLCGVFSLEIGRARSVFYQEPMFDLKRKWGLFANGEMASILSTTPLEFGWGRGIGIAGVATDPNFRNKGYASQLLAEVHKSSQKDNEGVAFLFATRPEIYLRAGYVILDEAVRGTIISSKKHNPLRQLSTAEVRKAYAKWADENPNRLRRDDRRWRLWQWNLKYCSEFGSGYIAMEGNTIREAIYDHSAKEWPVPAGSSWLGLKSILDQFNVPLESTHHELYLMGHGTDTIPEMFLTDQF